MEKLCFQFGSAEELWGKELEKPNKIPQLDTAELERTALIADSNLQQQELAAAYASELAIQTQSLQEKELSAAYATALPTELDRTALAMELESTALTLSTLKLKKLRRLQAFQQDSSTRACDPQLDASTSSPRTSRKQSSFENQNLSQLVSRDCHLDDSELDLAHLELLIQHLQLELYQLELSI